MNEFPTQIGWQQRFENFQNALQHIDTPLRARSVNQMSELEQYGIIQLFEVCVELGWKVMKDYLEFIGIHVTPVGPKTVIKQAFASEIIANGQAWIDMIEDRNKMSHEYAERYFKQTLNNIENRYLTEWKALETYLSIKRNI